MKASILELAKKRTVLLDGGMGTELFKRDFPMGACPESWNTEKPEAIKEIHKSYFEAGSDAVLTNSFGGSKIKLSSYKLGKHCYKLNRAAAELAQKTKSEGKFVGGSMGPTGKFLKPQGEYIEEEFEAAYFEQASGLSDGGVDFLLIETQYDLSETLCALRAAKKASDLPIFVTMTFNKTPRGYFTIMGINFSKFAEKMAEYEVAAIGANCTLDSKDMADLIKTAREHTSLPIIAQANAGQPQPSTDGKITYSQPVDDYVKYIPEAIKNGAGIIGGCCGTDPVYISRMAEILKLK